MSDVRKFLVFKSAREVYSGVTRHYLDLFSSAPLAIAAYVAGVLIFSYVSGNATRTGMSQEEPGSAMMQAWGHHVWLVPIIIILVTVGVLASAVRWHRFVLLGERHRAGWGSYENGYLWSSLKIGFSIFGVILVGALLVVFTSAISKSYGELASGVKTVSFILLIVAYFWLFIFVTRLSLALPDVALGGKGALGQAWDRSRDNGWRLLGYWILVQAAVGIGAKIIDVIVFALISQVLDAFTANIVATVVTLPVSIYVLMIGVTMLSVAYREIVGLPADSGGPDAERVAA